MDVSGPGGHPEIGRYCRDVEAHLCRKNDGHLIRIVGPAFELVSGWAEQGIPLRVVLEGIDRCFERYYRTGARRRPLHISFCADEVLDVFEAWRRATGVPAAEGAPEPEAEERRQKVGLVRHLERTIARLTARRAGASPALDQALDRVVRELDTLRHTGKAPRGEARVRLLDRLRALDEELVSEARHSLSPADLDALAREADESLAPFRARMPEAAWEEARAAATNRAVRAALGLPVLAFE